MKNVKAMKLLWIPLVVILIGGIGFCILGYADGEPKPQSPRKSDYVIWAK